MRQSESKVTMMLGENGPNSFDWIGETVTALTTVLLVYTHTHTLHRTTAKNLNKHARRHIYTRYEQ